MKNSDSSACKMRIFAFTLVEMLMALLIVSVILTASLPVITTRQKALATTVNNNPSFPIGGIIVWYHQQLPDSTWLECNGQQIPSGIEYESARQIFGTNMPNFQGMFLRGFGSQSFTQNNGSIIGNTSTVYSSGVIGTIQGDALREISGYFYNDGEGGQSRTKTGIFYLYGSWSNPVTPGHTDSSMTDIVGFKSSRVVPTANEIRPVNIAVKYIAKVRY